MAVLPATFSKPRLRMLVLRRASRGSVISPSVCSLQMGYYSPRERLIVVRENPMLQKTKTLAHELGHHFAGHGAEGEQSPREEQETVAESVSYVTLAHFGLDSGERSFPYIATWAKDQNTLKGALGQIQKVSATLIERVE